MRPARPPDRSSSARARSGASARSRCARTRSAAEGRLWAAVPPSIARSSTGFTYYAVIRSVDERQHGDLAGGRRRGSAAQPAPRWRRRGRRSRRTSSDGDEAADERVVEASWGSGPGEVGLEDIGIERHADRRLLVRRERRRRRLRAGRGEPAHAALEEGRRRGREHVALGDQRHPGRHVGRRRRDHPRPRERTRRRTSERFCTTFAPTGRRERQRPRSPTAPRRSGSVRLARSSSRALRASGRRRRTTGQTLSLAAQNALGPCRARPLGGGREVVVLRTRQRDPRRVDRARAPFAGRGA